MAGNRILQNLKSQTKSLTDKLKDNVAETASKAGFHDSAKGKLKAMLSERQKMYEFMGMEVYLLYPAGHKDMEVILPFCERITALNAEIEVLERELAQASNSCACGAKLIKGANFCPVCGKSVAASLPEPEPEPEPEAVMAECVCGAVYPCGTSLCMTCGRRL